MKRGDAHSVMLGQYEVAQAVVVDFDGDDKVILEIPATRIVMGINSSLGDLPQDPNAKEHLIIGTDDARSALEAEGIELDEEPDFTPRESGSGEVSLRDMALDSDV